MTDPRAEKEMPCICDCWCVNMVKADGTEDYCKDCEETCCKQGPFGESTGSFTVKIMEIPGMLEEE